MVVYFFGVHSKWNFPWNGYTFPTLLNLVYGLIHRLIYMNQGLSVVAKWVHSWINVETTLKWDCMFVSVAIITFSLMKKVKTSC